MIITKAAVTGFGAGAVAATYASMTIGTGNVISAVTVGGPIGAVLAVMVVAAYHLQQQADQVDQNT